jgi:hypothetical protein
VPCEQATARGAPRLPQAAPHALLGLGDKGEVCGGGCEGAAQQARLSAQLGKLRAVHLCGSRLQEQIGGWADEWS